MQGWQNRPRAIPESLPRTKKSLPCRTMPVTFTKSADRIEESGCVSAHPLFAQLVENRAFDYRHVHSTFPSVLVATCPQA